MAAMGMGLSSLTKLRYLLVAVALILLATLQVHAQEEDSGNSSIIIQLPVANFTNSGGGTNATQNDRGLSIEVHTTGHTILDRADIDTCLEYAEEKINAYPAEAQVIRNRRPGHDIFIPYATATVEIAAWMKGPTYPQEVIWADLYQIVQGIKKYVDEQTSNEPIAVAGLIQGEVFAYIAVAATQAKTVASS